MKSYSLSEIKQELLKEIGELEEKDPSWKNCRKCPFRGKCCIDNDIDIRDDEWEEIKALLDQNESIRNQVKENFINNRKCYFRTEKCCLIHPIRPTNCLYTPYQAIQNEFSLEVEYSLRSPSCDFETKTISLDKPLKKEDYLLYIPDSEHYYLLLNHWYGNFEERSEACFKDLAYWRLKEYFQQ